jgi:putative phosphoribosyl transferase
MTLFKDRIDAGHRLAVTLKERVQGHDILVLALPRGGVPVGSVVAEALGADLDVFLVRKLGVPWHQELAMGAISSGGMTVMNESILRTMNVSQAEIDSVIDRERNELSRRERLYRGDRPPPVISDRTIIVVDDGLATGSSMRAALQALRKQEPGFLATAVPVGPADVCRQLAKEADEAICLFTPSPFEAVGRWFVRFEQTSDQEVQTYLHQAWSQGDAD